MTRATAGFGRWVDAVHAELTTYRTDRQAAIASSLGATRDLRKAYEADLGRPQALRQGSLSTAASNLDRSISWSLRVLLVGVAVVLLAGLLVSTWVIRFIAQPLHSLAALLTG